MGLTKEKCSKFWYNNLTLVNWCECTSSANTNLLINLIIKSPRISFNTVSLCLYVYVISAHDVRNFYMLIRHPHDSLLPPNLQNPKYGLDEKFKRLCAVYHCHKIRVQGEISRWVVWDFCPQEGACKIPVPKWSDQGDILVSHLEKPLHFNNSNS